MPTCRSDRDLTRPTFPSTYVPARNTIFLVAGARLGRGARRARHRHRRQRARLLRLSRLPAGVHRGVRAARRAGDRGRASRAPGFTVHAPLIALTKAEIVRARRRARPRLRPDAQLLRPGRRRTAVRPLRQLRAARPGLRRGRCRRSAAGAAQQIVVTPCHELRRQPASRAAIP